MTGAPQAPWHILEASSVPAIEFAKALSSFAPVFGWVPEMKWVSRSGYVPSSPEGEKPVQMVRFPLQRGYSHPIVSRLLQLPQRAREMLLLLSPNPQASPLVCTTPFFAPAAETWPGPVIYYSLDYTYAYEGLKAKHILHLEKRLCRKARLVCPVSHRIADYLVYKAGCDPAKIRVLPNAVRAANVRPSPSDEPYPLPSELAGLKRPIAGVIGNMADNVDWELLYQAITTDRSFSWLFVGPTSMQIRDPHQRRVRRTVMSLRERVRFIGPKPYTELYRYARALDVAIMPYRKKEPTYSGSATRFYEHLAAGRPILSTRGVAELEEKEPLLQLFDGPGQLVEALQMLQSLSFRDGFGVARWHQSHKETWEERAQIMFRELRTVLAMDTNCRLKKPAVKNRA